MTAEVAETADPTADVAPEADFLFHLYRGSELLSDHRLLEAQSELEYALTIQPLDARTHGLLAVVFFRRGLYARAIGTYRELLRDRPDDPTLRLNLALCYLKTGQPQGARVELEALVMEDIEDLRAWGYLAVALQRLGYVEQAQEAFARAGHAELGQRKADRGVPLDSGELSFELVDASGGRRDSFRPSVPAPMPAPPAPKLDTLGWGTHLRAAAPSNAWLAPPPLANFIEDARLERIGDAPGVTLLGSRLARVDIGAAEDRPRPLGFAFRLESLRSYTGTLDREILPRQMRADLSSPDLAAGETFGGIGTPFATMKSLGQIVVGPRASQRIVAFALRDEAVFFREEAILGFDLSLHYENGRLGPGGGGGSGGGDGSPLVQLRGDGTVLLELAADLLAIEVKVGGLTVRKEVVVGWVGRLLPRSLTGEEAPCGQRGLIGFSGEGVVLVTAK
jgi:hypothetical protein